MYRSWANVRGVATRMSEHTSKNGDMAASLCKHSLFDTFAASQQSKQCLFQPFQLSNFGLTSASRQFHGESHDIDFDSSKIKVGSSIWIVLYYPEQAPTPV